MTRRRMQTSPPGALAAAIGALASYGNGRLYVRLVRETGYDKQRSDNTEVWVYEAAEHQQRGSPRPFHGRHLTSASICSCAICLSYACVEWPFDEPDSHSFRDRRVACRGRRRLHVRKRARRRLRRGARRIRALRGRSSTADMTAPALGTPPRAATRRDTAEPVSY